MNRVSLLGSPVLAGCGIRVRDVNRAPCSQQPNVAMTARHRQKPVVFWYLSPNAKCKMHLVRLASLPMIGKNRQ